MKIDRREELAALGQGVRELLARVDAKRLQMRSDHTNIAVGERIALALLELDRISLESRLGAGALPAFASDFLNRRLTRRLLDRYPGSQLAAELDRRLGATLESLDDDSFDPLAAPTYERLRTVLAELRLALAPG